MSNNKWTAKRVIREEQFRLVKEYPAVIRVYENVAGDCVHDIMETSTGTYTYLSSGELLPALSRNRDEIPERIPYLDFLKGCSRGVLPSYRKNRRYSERAMEATYH